MTLGKVYLVGAGPGKRDLLTCRGAQCLEMADAVVYDQLACPSVLNLVKPSCELYFAGKEASHHVKPQWETNALLVALAKQGKQVVRLKGGDPFVFGRGGEEAQCLSAQGIPFEVVSGVSSCYSVPAFAGIPVTHRACASAFHVVTGHRQSGQSEAPDYGVLAKLDGTLVFLMSLTNLPQIAQGLLKNGKCPDTPVAVVQQGTTAHQRVATGTLETIVAEVKRQNIGTPAMTIIGAAVSLRQELQWFEKGALFGKKVIATGTPVYAKKLAEQLQTYGADTAEISLILPESLDTACLKKLAWQSYTWAVLTSANGVQLFFEALRQNGVDLRNLLHLRFAAIGSGTASALQEKGIYVDCVPERFDSKCLAEALIPQLSEQDRVLLLRAENGTAVLSELLQSAGKQVTSVSLYQTVPDFRKKELLQWHLADADYVVLASASAVSAYAQMGVPSGAKVISIGAVTTKAAEQYQISVTATAQESTAEGIVQCILQDVKQEKEVL